MMYVRIAYLIFYALTAIIMLVIATKAHTGLDVVWCVFIAFMAIICAIDVWLTIKAKRNENPY